MQGGTVGRVVTSRADGVPEALGMPGLTAWAGLFRVADHRAGDTVSVRVVGSAGTPEKVAWLRSLGFDAAFDHHDGRVADLLAQAAAEGIDVFFDDVGGDHVEAAIGAFRTFGRGRCAAPSPGTARWARPPAPAACG
jgi:hypothetical protein